MIRLQQGSNQIYMTLDESNYGSSYSVLRAVDNMSGAESLCILGNDISPNPSRYNQFSLTVGTSSIVNEQRVVVTDGGGLTGSLYSSADLIDWFILDTPTIQEETRSVLMQSRDRLYVITTNSNFDIWTDDGGLTFGTSSTSIEFPADPFYSKDIDRLIIPSVSTTSSSYSDDGGVTFNYSDKNTSQGGRGAYSDELGLGVFLTLDNNYITTTNGIDWSMPVSSGVITNNITTLYWFNELNLFVGVQVAGSSRGVVYSPDGVNWTQVQFSSFGFGNGLNYDICFNKDLDLLMITNDLGGNEQRIITSPDAINWTISATNSLAGIPLACEYSPTFGFMTITDNGYVYTTTDMITYQTHYIGQGYTCRDIKLVEISTYNNEILVLNNEGQYNYEIWGMIGDAPVGTASILYNGTLLEKGRIVLQ
jgi:hypothetical protein